MTKIVQLNETKLDGVINRIRECIDEFEHAIDDLYYMDREQLQCVFSITLDGDLSLNDNFAPYRNFLSHWGISEYTLILIDFSQCLIIFRDKGDAATFKMWFDCQK